MTSNAKFYLSSPYRVVGGGKVYNLRGDVLHNRPIPTGHVRVVIEVVYEPDANLPVPIEEDDLTVLSDSIGAFVAWPLNLIAIDGVVCPNSDFIVEYN